MLVKSSSGTFVNSNYQIPIADWDKRSLVYPNHTRCTEVLQQLIAPKIQTKDISHKTYVHYYYTMLICLDPCLIALLFSFRLAEIAATLAGEATEKWEDGA